LLVVLGLAPPFHAMILKDKTLANYGRVPNRTIQPDARVRGAVEERSAFRT